MASWPIQRDVECDPKLDGLTHINVWSRGKTLLGRQLSNMYPAGVYIPKYGFFCCLEGYWWFVVTGFKFPQFKNYNGFDARREGSKLPKVHQEDFVSIIKEALTLKVKETNGLQELLNSNTLPLTHYYVYGKAPNQKVHLANNSLWQLDHFISLTLRDSDTS